jgi:DNA modification methylase
MKEVVFLTEDACSLSVKSNSVDLIITAPPYITVDVERYGGDSKKQINYSQDFKKNLKLLVKATKQMERILKPTGSIIIDIGHYKDMPYHYVVEVLSKTGLFLANPPFIQDYYQESFNLDREKLRNSYCYWFHFVKDPNKMYHNPFMVKRYSDNIWSIPWENEEDREINTKLDLIGWVSDSINPEVPKRFIEMFSRPGETVMDPFGGTGTVACVAHLNNRNAITNDVSEEQTKIAKKRLELYKERISK